MPRGIRKGKIAMSHTFVLVHGAMHGGWCWREVRQRLSGNGHEVYAPTLTGQGDRRRGLTPQVGIADHVPELLGGRGDLTATAYRRHDREA